MEQKFICLRNREIPNIKEIDVYLAHGGYGAIARALKMAPDAVIEEVKRSGLRGRGGAGFPTGVKWGFIPKGVFPKYVVVNADESEPGTFKDREIMQENPHQVIEGALLAAYAIQAEAVYIYIRGEYRTIAAAMDKKIAEARAKGFIGRNILGSGWHCEVYTHLGAGAYVCGEETAMLNSIEGKRGQARVRPPFPTDAGLYDQPTLVNNVETIANVPFIIGNGAKAFREVGVENNYGTNVFCVSGHVKNPGNYELSLGGETTLRRIIDELAGGTPSGLPVKGILPAGSVSIILPATDEVLDMPLTFDSLKRFGSSLGSSSIIIMDESVDMAWATWKMLEFFTEESCGQCVPCRMGTHEMRNNVEKILKGNGTENDLQTLQALAEIAAAMSICGLGQLAPNPFLGTFRYFPQEYLDKLVELPTYE